MTGRHLDGTMPPAAAFGRNSAAVATSPPKRGMEGLLRTRSGQNCLTPVNLRSMIGCNDCAELHGLGTAVGREVKSHSAAPSAKIAAGDFCGLHRAFGATCLGWRGL